eukprot:CAMPEP_0184388220 /NCGR_PEP_ID=MMETSP0007-20130409/11417_1 /TAXON_ID=97485 /ORGANISM="Prymnesium parvum, Strain Texoma1" /LENGTH=64 /DNA_ID=CAMNT_0026736961 /DNA_START=142 /DNA_END=333 /DNA_ORIENTATION=+
MPSIWTLLKSSCADREPSLQLTAAQLRLRSASLVRGDRQKSRARWRHLDGGSVSAAIQDPLGSR